MPIRKYRSVEQMPGPPAASRLDANNLRQACDLMELGARLFPVRYDPGIRKFRTLEEANRLRDAIEMEGVRTRSTRRAAPRG